MKKMLVSDYDKTFYTNDIDIEINKSSVNTFRNKGNIFVFATGRSYADFKEVETKFSLKYDYLIFNHGATIIDKNENIIEHNFIENIFLQNIISELEIENSTYYFCCNLENSRATLDDKDISKINIEYGTHEKAMQINNLLNKKYSNNITSFLINNNTIEIISSITSKAKAIEKVIQLENIEKSNVYTIGDGYSDIEMIKNYNGYCMKNSVPELLNYCNKNSVDSVSQLINIL